LEIKFSRHAKRRAKLYKIDEKSIIEILQKHTLVEGKSEIVCKIRGLQLPLKIVYLMGKKVVLVITNYPLKKERKQ
jgi:hypothetical protein